MVCLAQLNNKNWFKSKGDGVLLHDDETAVSMHGMSRHPDL